MAARRRAAPSTRTRATHEALDAFATLARLEGILPALESSHAVAHAHRPGRGTSGRDAIVLVNLSGRGDKDLQTVAEAQDEDEGAERMKGSAVAR